MGATVGLDVVVKRTIPSSAGNRTPVVQPVANLKTFKVIPVQLPSLVVFRDLTTSRSSVWVLLVFERP
jgi:hypothetical protein